MSRLRVFVGMGTFLTIVVYGVLSVLGFNYLLGAALGGFSLAFVVAYLSNGAEE